MGAILKFILMSIVVTYVVNQLFKLIGLFGGGNKETLKKTVEHIHNQYKEGYRKEGDIYVSNIPDSGKKARMQGGDYVDYEEVK